jgi:hypothetical protein
MNIIRSIFSDPVFNLVLGFSVGVLGSVYLITDALTDERFLAACKQMVQ